jgi:cell division protein FtsB
MPPPANHTSAAVRGSREALAHRDDARPRQVPRRLARSRVGWDRKFRIVMIASLALVGWIGLKAGLALLQARSQASQESALISSLQTQHRQLVAREHALYQPATIEGDARALGMVRAGERPYVVISASGR